jgi:hypothetical protein
MHYDKRMGLTFTIAAGPLRSASCETHDHILQSHIRESPNLEGQIPVFISPRNRAALLYPQVLGSLFVASYDSVEVAGLSSSLDWVVHVSITAAI